MLLAATCCMCCHGAWEKPCQVAGTNVREQVAGWEPSCYPLEVKVPRDLEPSVPWLGPCCEQFTVLYSTQFTVHYRAEGGSSRK